MKQPIATAFRYAGKLLHWWALELSAALDDLRAHFAPRWRKSIVIFVSRSRLQVVDGHPGNSSPIVDLPWQHSASQLTPPALEGESAASLHGRRAHVVFDPQLAFIHSLQMPLAAVSYLESALDLQKQKLLPMDATLLSTDFEVIATDPQSKLVEIELAALKRADIEPVESMIEQWGMQPGAIQLGRASDSQRRFKFGASSTRVSRFAFTRAESWWLASATCLAFCAVLVFVVQAVRADRFLAQALAETTAEAAGVLEQRQQINTRLDTLALLAQAERPPTAAAILTEVTAHLDRDAWLINFELKGNDLRLVGLSTDPARIVKELATSTLITRVELHSSMAAPAGVITGKDRFEITARVRTGT